MTDVPEKPQRQSFFSQLRQRSAIIFTIGLAISVASFVENLHMGKAAIAFVVDELSKVQGLEDIVRAAAAMLHGALEWWRGVLRDLFSFLPFEIPQWMHDPLSVALFGVGRAYRFGSEILRPEDPKIWRVMDALFPPENREPLTPSALARGRRVGLGFRLRDLGFAFREVTLYLGAMSLLVVGDLVAYQRDSFVGAALESRTLYALLAIVLLFGLVSGFLFRVSRHYLAQYNATRDRVRRRRLKHLNPPEH